jgi:hypothetical protein
MNEVRQTVGSLRTVRPSVEEETAMSTVTAPDLGWLTCEIVVLGDPERDLTASYRITCRELETGRFVGSAVLPASPDGGPPRISLGDIVRLIGGYRFASIYVEIESERLARRNRAVSERLRHRDRGWLRRAGQYGLFETALKRSPPIMNAGGS